MNGVKIDYYRPFHQFELNPESQISQSTLIPRLDKLCGRNFDRDVAGQLFERMLQIKPQGNYQLKDFVLVVQEAQSILMEKIKRADELLTDQRKQKKLLQSQVAAIATSSKLERSNVYGMSEESKFTIIIHEGRSMGGSLQFSSKGEGSDIPPFVLMNCGKYEYKTKPGYSSLDSPQWDEEFTFPIEMGTEILTLKVLKNKGNQTILIGYSSFDVSEFRDQRARTLWLDLKTLEGKLSPAQLNITCQLMTGQNRIQSESVLRMKDEIRMIKRDKSDYEIDLKIINEPFVGNTTNVHLNFVSFGAETGNYSSKPVRIQQDLYTDGYLGADGKEKGFAVPNKHQEVPINDVNPALDPRVKKKIILPKYMLIATLVFTLLTIFTCFMRPSFIDLLICALILTAICIDFYERNFIKAVLFLTVMSLVLDIPWFVIYTKNWWHTENYIELSYYERDIRRFSVVFSYFTFFYKFFLLFLYWEFSKFTEKLNEKLEFRLESNANNLPVMPVVK